MTTAQSKLLLDSYFDETEAAARTGTTLLSLAFENLLAFRRPTAVQMAPTALVGPNASGKSSLFFIVAFVLYGEYAAVVCNNQETDAYGEMTFTVDGAAYRIRREIANGQRVRGVLTADGGEKKRKLPAARKAMEALLGVDFAQFVALNTLRAPFSAMTPTALRAVFVKQVGMKRYDCAFRAVAADIKATVLREAEIAAVLGAAEIKPSDFRDRENLHAVVERCYVAGTKRVTDAYARFTKFRKYADISVEAEMRRLKADRAAEVADLLPGGSPYSYEALEEMIAVRAAGKGASLKARLAADPRRRLAFTELDAHFGAGGTWETAEADVAALRAQKNHVASVENIAEIDAELEDIRAYVGVAAEMEAAELQIRQMQETVAANAAAAKTVARQAIAAELMEKYGQITPERHAELSEELSAAAEKRSALQALLESKTAFYDAAAAEYILAVTAEASEESGFAVTVRDGALLIGSGSSAAVAAQFASGYERARVEMALRCAMHRLSGAPVVDFLFADETLDCFDAAHADVVPAILDAALAFGAVFVVTHSAAVRARLPPAYTAVTGYY